MQFRATVYLGPNAAEAKAVYDGLKKREGKPYTFMDKTVFPHEPVTGDLVEVSISHHERAIHRGQGKAWSSVTIVIDLDFTKELERRAAKRILNGLDGKSVKPIGILKASDTKPRSMIAKPLNQMEIYQKLSNEDLKGEK